MRQSDAGTTEPGGDRRDELDARVEMLAQQIAEVINEAAPGARAGLREYAADLVRGATEAAEVAPAPAAAGPRPHTNPLGLALLLGAMAVPMLLVFVPLGLMLAVAAVVLGAVGVGMTVLRR